MNAHTLQWYQHRGCVGAEPAHQNTVAGAVACLTAYAGETAFAGLEFDACWDGEVDAWRVCHDLPPAGEPAPPLLCAYLAAVAGPLAAGGRRLQLEVKTVGDFAALDALIAEHGLAARLTF